MPEERLHGGEGPLPHPRPIGADGRMASQGPDANVRDPAPTGFARSAAEIHDVIGHTTALVTDTSLLEKPSKPGPRYQRIPERGRNRHWQSPLGTHNEHLFADANPQVCRGAGWPT